MVNVVTDFSVLTFDMQSTNMVKREMLNLVPESGSF